MDLSLHVKFRYLLTCRVGVGVNRAQNTSLEAVIKKKKKELEFKWPSLANGTAYAGLDQPVGEMARGRFSSGTNASEELSLM